MKYVNRVLGRDEQIVYETGLHWALFLRPILLLLLAICAVAVPVTPDNTATQALIVFVLLLFFVFSLLRAFVDWWTTEIAVTTKRVIFKRGLIRRDTIELNLNRVEGLDVQQSVLGRMLGYGTVTIRGTGLGTQPMKMIRAPLRLRTNAFQTSDVA